LHFTCAYICQPFRCAHLPVTCMLACPSADFSSERERERERVEGNEIERERENIHDTSSSLTRTSTFWSKRQRDSDMERLLDRGTSRQRNRTLHTIHERGCSFPQKSLHCCGNEQTCGCTFASIHPCIQLRIVLWYVQITCPPSDLHKGLRPVLPFGNFWHAMGNLAPKKAVRSPATRWLPHTDFSQQRPDLATSAVASAAQPMSRQQTECCWQ